jgi:tetratricopeptide (TPR) repeat protein
MATTRSQGILVAGLLASGFAVAPAPCQTDEGTIDQSQVASEAGRCYAAEDPESCFSQWLDDDPSAVVYSLRAYHRFKLNHFREAESDLTAAISMDPTNPSHLNGRADVREELGLNAQAEKDREAARDLIRRGYPELRRLDLRLAENPDDLDALYERSLELERIGAHRCQV